MGSAKQMEILSLLFSEDTPVFMFNTDEEGHLVDAIYTVGPRRAGADGGR